jgi:hypothetical protein
MPTVRFIRGCFCVAVCFYPWITRLWNLHSLLPSITRVGGDHSLSPEPEALSSTTLSVWNFPPIQCRLKGHLLPHHIPLSTLPVYLSLLPPLPAKLETRAGESPKVLPTAGAWEAPYRDTASPIALSQVPSLAQQVPFP